MNMIPKKAKQPMFSLSQIMSVWMMLVCLAVFASGAQTYIAIRHLQHPARSGGDPAPFMEAATVTSANSDETCHDNEWIIRGMVASFIIMCLTIFLGFAVLYHRLVMPLKKIVSALQDVRDGNLAVTFDSGGCHDITQIDSLLNDVASDFQEAVLLTWSHSAKIVDSCDRLLAMIPDTRDDDQTLSVEIGMIQERIQEIKKIIGGIEFYDVSIKENKLIGG